MIRSPEDRGSASSVNLHSCSTFPNRLHGIIIVVIVIDPRVKEGTLKKFLSPFREILFKTGKLSSCFYHFTLRMFLKTL